MDIQIGKNKYKLTIGLVVAVGTFVVGSISWVLSLQMTVESTKLEIE